MWANKKSYDKNKRRSTVETSFNPLNPFVYVFIFLWMVCVGLLFYLGLKDSQLPIKNTLLVVPKETTLSVLDIKSLEKINEEKLMLTYETNDIVSVEVLDKSFTAKAIGTNYTYPYVYKLPLLSGGFFTKDIQESKRKVVILNKTSAFYFFGNVNIMDEEVTMNNELYTVVGVIDDKDEDNNIIYYPITLSKKQPSTLLVSLAETSQENASTILNELQISSKNYFFTNLEHVQDMIQGKFWMSIDLSAFLLLIFLCFKMLIILKNQISQIKMSLEKEIYLQNILQRKPINLLKVVASSSLLAGFLWGIFLLFSKYVIKLLQWDIELDGIKLADTFGIVTENILEYNQYTSIIWIIFCLILIYAIVTKIVKRVIH